jgi:thiosulfate dehydrogenase (quinone) large subunit
MQGIDVQRGRQFLRDPYWTQVVFNTTEFTWLWLIARVYIGWQWLDAGRHKLESDAWMSTGAALKGFWERAVAVPESGRPPVTYDWYREFLSFMLNAEWYTWFAKLIAVGELLIGLALLLGILTGLAALFGAFMNWHFMMAGTASTNPVMLIVAIGILLAWKTAGWWGLDRFVLPYLGTPWQRGALFGSQKVRLPTLVGHAYQHPVEQWVRMLIGAGVALYALAALEGALQFSILVAAFVWIAITGLGRLSVVKAPT